MSKQRRLIEIATTISAAAEQLDEFYDAEALELRFPDGKPSSDHGQAIGRALEAALQLQRMLLGPLGSLMSLSGGLYDITCLHVIHDFSIAKHVPSEGTIAVDQLATLCNLPAVQLRSILRYAMTNRIFTEPVPGVIAHTPLSKRLADDPVMRATVGMLADEMFPAAACLSRALQDRDSTDATDTAWGLANGAQRPMVEELEAAHPARATQFAAFMKYNWTVQNPLQPLLDNYDWAALGNKHVVDIGGGLGHASIALARAFPNLTFTVQDFKNVVEEGERDFLQDTPEQSELRKRLTFMAHDAFEEQPVKGAGVYLLRSVLHDWPDKSCVTILQRLVPALEKGAIVLINDYVMPDPGELSFMDERRARSLDLTMTSLFNAREREGNEWKPLFEQADPRFEFKGIHPSTVNSTSIPTKKLLSLIEATWSG